MSATQNILKELKHANIALNNLETLAGVAEMQSVPSHLEIDFSSRCNLRCPMCHQAKLDMGNLRLSKTDLDTLIDSLPFRETVMIAGLGEPLLYRGLAEFLPYLRRYQCQSHLFTNGQLIDRHLHLLHNLDRISVSFDGATVSTFEYLRKNASFARVCANVIKLRAAAPQTRIVTSTVISNRNVHELTDLVRLAASLGFDEVHLSPVDHTPSLSLTTAHQHAFDSQLDQAKQIAEKHRLALINNISALHFNDHRNSLVTEQDLFFTTPRKSALNPLNDDDPEGDQDLIGNELNGAIHRLSTEQEHAELMKRLTRLQIALKTLGAALKKKQENLALPYCSAPWKYAFARSNGKARLCPYADLDMGAVCQLQGQNYNSASLQQIRHAIAKAEPNLAVCRTCTDDHRQFKRADLEEFAAKF
jgi:MoaA/NifB/PqqE/SkfB family radical SAM enzyme